MPGSLFELVCPSCGAVHEISTGASRCIEHGQPWSYEQVVCARCQQLSSQAVGCHFEREPCSDCDGPVNSWSGRVFFERTGSEPWEQRERVEGPCPACGATLHESDTRIQGLWD